MRLDVGPYSHPYVEKLKIVEKPEKVDMKFNDLQKLMVDHFTDFLKVVKEGFASYGKVAHYPVHESEKDIPNREGDPPQSVNEHNIDAKSDNIVEDADNPLKKGKDEHYTVKYTDLKWKLDFHIDVVTYYLHKKAKLDTTSEYRYTTMNCMFKNYIHDTYTHYHRSQSEIDLSLQDKNVHSMKLASVERSICEIIQGRCISTVAYAEFLSDGNQISSPEFDPQMHRTRYASLLWDYGVNKASNESVSYNQDPPGLNTPSFHLRI
ncbi:hypothetical protein FXO38_15546 [Capsicum annuum]|nr:hypothetical protein FXO38_15546 [Capsicum annuum]